jgi:hypothetical protein
MIFFDFFRYLVKINMPDLFIHFCGFIIFSSFTLLYLVIPISEVVIGVFYKDLLNINNDIINFDKWLIVNGSLSICTSATIIFYSTSSNKSFVNCTSVCLLYIFNLANLIWIIIGTYIFFGNYNYNKIQSGNLIAYLFLIFALSYLSVFQNVCINNNRKNQAKQQKLPK